LLSLKIYDIVSWLLRDTYFCRTLLTLEITIKVIHYANKIKPLL